MPRRRRSNSVRTAVRSPEAQNRPFVAPRSTASGGIRRASDDLRPRSPAKTGLISTYAQNVVAAGKLRALGQSALPLSKERHAPFSNRARGSDSKLDPCRCLRASFATLGPRIPTTSGRIPRASSRRLAMNHVTSGPTAGAPFQTCELDRVPTLRSSTPRGEPRGVENARRKSSGWTILRNFQFLRRRRHKRRNAHAS